MQDKPRKVNTTSNEIRFDSSRVDAILNVGACKIDIPMSARYATTVYRPEPRHDPRCVAHRFTAPQTTHVSPSRVRPSSKTLNHQNSQLQVGDATYIGPGTQETTSENASNIPDMYTVPFDSDIYAVPVDMVRPCHSINIKPRVKKTRKSHKRRNKGVSHIPYSAPPIGDATNEAGPSSNNSESKSKRHSLPGTSDKKAEESDTDTLHRTLREMRKYLNTLYSSSSSDADQQMLTLPYYNEKYRQQADKAVSCDPKDIETFMNIDNDDNKQIIKRSGAIILKPKKNKNTEIVKIDKKKESPKSNYNRNIYTPVRTLTINFKQTLCNWFRWRRHTPTEILEEIPSNEVSIPSMVRRALPPLPTSQSTRRNVNGQVVMDFATSIEKVKDCGWYWGPITVDAAEKILSNEPDGSFIVRDSNDDHYIFTLTFKLNGMRHVRIEHDQGEYTKVIKTTI